MRHIEASDVVRTFNGGPHQGETALNFAHRILGTYGPDVAARRIVDEYFGERLNDGFVITGFRTVQELLYLREQIPRTRVLLIEAPFRVRYERFRVRSRSDERLSAEEFKQRDLDQAAFGLLDIALHLADIRLTNDQHLKAYRRQIEAVLSGVSPGDISGVRVASSKDRTDTSQLYRCLATLAVAGRPLSTDEIEAETKIRHNNANKVLRRHPSLARRLELPTSRLRYAITDAGRAFVSYMEHYSAAEPAPVASASIRGNSS